MADNSHPFLYLCVRAADGNKDIAAPLHSTHQILIVCEVLEIHPTLIPINPNHKNKEFRNIITSGKLPALVYGKEEPYNVLDDSAEEIIEFLQRANEKIDPDPRKSLTCSNKAALVLQRRSFLSSFRMMMRNKAMEDKAKANLMDDLHWLDIMLTAQNTKFLDGDTIKFPDAHLLPLLHLIRVAGKVKNFEISEKFTRVWEYMLAAENSPAFTKYKPSDKLIISHWTSAN